MLTWLLNVDRELFFLINRDLQNLFFDLIMPFITNQRNWTPLFVVIILGLLWKGGRKGRWALLLLAAALTLSDQLSSSVIKPLVKRERPCVTYGELGMVHLPTGITRSPSFPSSHAANSASAATVLAFLYPQWRTVCVLAAALVAFSRVYVGVHYPLDVLAGALLGFLSGALVVFIFRIFEKRHLQKTQMKSEQQNELNIRSE